MTSCFGSHVDMSSIILGICEDFTSMTSTSTASSAHREGVGSGHGDRSVEGDTSTASHAESYFTMTRHHTTWHNFRVTNIPPKGTPNGTSENVGECFSLGISVKIVFTFCRPIGFPAHSHKNTRRTTETLKTPLKPHSSPQNSQENARWIPLIFQGIPIQN